MCIYVCVCVCVCVCVSVCAFIYIYNQYFLLTIYYQKFLSLILSGSFRLQCNFTSIKPKILKATFTQKQSKETEGSPQKQLPTPTTPMT